MPYVFENGTIAFILHPHNLRYDWGCVKAGHPMHSTEPRLASRPLAVRSGWEQAPVESWRWWISVTVGPTGELLSRRQRTSSAAALLKNSCEILPLRRETTKFCLCGESQTQFCCRSWRVGEWLSGSAKMYLMYYVNENGSKVYTMKVIVFPSCWWLWHLLMPFLTFAFDRRGEGVAHTKMVAQAISVRPERISKTMVYYLLERNVGVVFHVIQFRV